MKKMITVFVAALMLFAVTGCSGNLFAPFDYETPETMGDVMEHIPNAEYSGSEGYTFYYACELGGSYYRFKGEMTQEQYDAFNSIDFSAEDAQEQRDAIVSEIVITDRQQLDDQILSRDDLDALVGKTGQELLDAGWTPGYGYDLETGEFSLFYGPFSYKVVFDGEFEESDEIYDDEEYFKDRTVTSAKFDSLGDNSNW